jgi:hypothetical protein
VVLDAKQDNFLLDDHEIKELSHNSDANSALVELNQEAINELRNEDAAAALEPLKRAE